MPHSRCYQYDHAWGDRSCRIGIGLPVHSRLSALTGATTMIGTTDPGRGPIHRLGFAAAALFALATVSGQPAQAMSPVAPGAMPAAKSASNLVTVQMRGGHGGGGGGGGSHGGG